MSEKLVRVLLWIWCLVIYTYAMVCWFYILFASAELWESTVATLLILVLGVLLGLITGSEYKKLS